MAPDDTGLADLCNGRLFNRKLTYLAAYLIATKGTLKAGELEAITGAADLVG